MTITMEKEREKRVTSRAVRVLYLEFDGRHMGLEANEFNTTSLLLGEHEALEFRHFQRSFAEIVREGQQALRRVLGFRGRFGLWSVDFFKTGAYGCRASAFFVLGFGWRGVALGWDGGGTRHHGTAGVAACGRGSGVFVFFVLLVRVVTDDNDGGEMGSSLLCEEPFSFQPSFLELFRVGLLRSAGVDGASSGASRGSPDGRAARLQGASRHVQM